MTNLAANDSPRAPSARAPQLTAAATAATRPRAARPRRRDCHERNPRDEAGELCHGESSERRVVVGLHRGVGDPGSVPQLQTGGNASDVRRAASRPRSRRALPALRFSAARAPERAPGAGDPAATAEPTVGTWFRSRCRWERLGGDRLCSYGTR